MRERVKERAAVGRAAAKAAAGNGARRLCSICQHRAIYHAARCHHPLHRIA